MVGTIAVLIGLLFTRAGTPEADSIAALVVAVLVVVAAVRLMRRNVDVLMDATPEEAQAAARAAIADAEPEIELRRLRVRAAAGRNFVEATIAVPPDAALGEGHAVADSIEDAVRARCPAATSSSTSSPAPAKATCVSARARRRSPSAACARSTTCASSTSTATRSCRCTSSCPPTWTSAPRTTSPAPSRPRSTPAVPEVVDIYTHIEPLSTDAEGAEPQWAEVAEEERIVRTHRPRAHRRASRGAALPGRRRRARRAAHRAPGRRADARPGPRRRQRAERRIREQAPAIDEVIVHTEPADAPRLSRLRRRRRLIAADAATAAKSAA